EAHAQIGGRLLGERDGGDLAEARPSGPDEVHDAAEEQRGLPAAGGGFDQEARVEVLARPAALLVVDEEQIAAHVSIPGRDRWERRRSWAAKGVTGPNPGSRGRRPPGRHAWRRPTASAPRRTRDRRRRARVRTHRVAGRTVRPGCRRGSSPGPDRSR